MLDQTEAVQSLASGHPFVGVLDADDATRALAIQRVSRSATAGQALLIRVGNPRRAPFTLERLREGLADARGDRAADAGIRRLCHPRHGERRIVLIIEQAETLVMAALVALQSAALEAATSAHPLQIVFAGTPAFLLRLRRPELSVMRYTLEPDLDDVVPTGSLAALLVPEEAAVEADAAPAPPRLPEDLVFAAGRGVRSKAEPMEGASATVAFMPPGRGPRLWPALLLAGAVLAGVGGWWLWPEERAAGPAAVAGATPAADAFTGSGEAAPTVVAGLTPMAVPAPGEAVAVAVAAAEPTPEKPPDPVVVAGGGPETPAPISAPGSIEGPAAPVPTPEHKMARLRQEFDAFLARSDHVAGTLGDAQRQALFDQFLQWRARASLRRQAEPATMRGR